MTESLLTIGRGSVIWSIAPAATWAAINPVMPASELCRESDTDRMKIGDGTTAWNDLPYFTGEFGDAATLNVGSTAGTVAAGDDTRIVGPVICPSALWMTPAGYAWVGAPATLDEVRLVRLMTGRVPIDGLAVDVTTGGAAGSVVRLALFWDANRDGVPDTLLIDAGTVDATSSGEKTVTFAPVTVPGSGEAWLAAGAQVAAPQLRFLLGNTADVAIGASGAVMTTQSYGWLLSGVSGAFPASIVPSYTANPISIAARRA